MADVLALEKLYDDVAALFVDEGTDCELVFGWRAPTEQTDHASRIVWIPGDPSGNAGTITGAKYPGRLPARPLATLVERFHVIVSVHDPADPDNERKQYAATRLLFDAWYRACYLSAHGTFRPDPPTWIKVERMERRLGAALRCVATIEAMIPDAPYETMPTDDASAEVAQADADDETLTVVRE